MSNRTMVESTKAFGVKQVLRYIDKNPDKNIPKLLSWMERYDKNGQLTHTIQTVRKSIEDKNSNWSKLVKSLWTDVDDGVRRKIFENFVINASLIGSPRQIQIGKENDCNVPWAILMDPTSACNMHCTDAGHQNMATS